MRTNPAASFAMADSRDQQRQRHVVENGPIVQQLVILEHHANPAPVSRDFAPRDPGGVLAVDNDLAPGRALDQCYQFQQRAFARTGMASQKTHLARAYMQAEVRQCLMTAGITLEDVFESDHDSALPAVGLSRAATNSRAENTSRSSACSPTPIKRIGKF